MNFLEWIVSFKHGKATDGAASFLSAWLLKKGKNRMPQEDLGSLENWKSFIRENSKVPSVLKTPLLACLSSSFVLYEKSLDSDISASVQHAPETCKSFFVAEPTVARLRTITKRGGSESSIIDREGSIDVHEFKGEVARVSRGVRVTKDLGGYESVQVSASVTIPCYVEEINEASLFASDFCNDEVEIELKKFTKSFKIMRTRNKQPEILLEDNCEKDIVENVNDVSHECKCFEKFVDIEMNQQKEIQKEIQKEEPQKDDVKTNSDWGF